MASLSKAESGYQHHPLVLSDACQHPSMKDLLSVASSEEGLGFCCWADALNMCIREGSEAHPAGVTENHTVVEQMNSHLKWDIRDFHMSKSGGYLLRESSVNKAVMAYLT